MPTVRRIALIVRRVAALPSSQDLTGPSLGDEPCVLKGRCGGTDEFLGRGVLFPQSPWTSVQGGRPLDKCLVQRHADAVWRKWPAAVSAAVNRSPVITTRKEDYSSLVRGAPVDRRGHIRVRRSAVFLGPAGGTGSRTPRGRDPRSTSPIAGSVLPVPGPSLRPVQRSGRSRSNGHDASPHILFSCEGYRDVTLRSREFS